VAVGQGQGQGQGESEKGGGKQSPAGCMQFTRARSASLSLVNEQEG
jgi:hypothetical protein